MTLLPRSNTPGLLRRFTVGRPVLLAICAICLVATAGPSTASGALAVEGGGSFNDAPLVTPGIVTDTIVTGEELYYAVDLQPGDLLTVRVQLRGKRSPLPGTYPTVTLRLHSPTRNADIENDYAEFTGRKTAKAQITGKAVGAGDPAYAEAGSYYAVLRLADIQDKTDKIPNLEYATRLEFDVQSDPDAAQANDATGGPSTSTSMSTGPTGAVPSPEHSATEAAPTKNDQLFGLPDELIVALAAVLGFLIGATGWTVIAAQRRSRRASS